MHARVRTDARARARKHAYGHASTRTCTGMHESARMESALNLLRRHGSLRRHGCLRLRSKQGSEKPGAAHEVPGEP